MKAHMGLCWQYFGASYKPLEPRGGEPRQLNQAYLGALGIVRGHWASLGLIGKTWLPFPRPNGIYEEWQAGGQTAQGLLQHHRTCTWRNPQ